MPKSRPFPFPDSQAGVFHVVSRIAGREFLLGDEEKEFFAKTLTPTRSCSACGC